MDSLAIANLPIRDAGLFQQSRRVKPQGLLKRIGGALGASIKEIAYPAHHKLMMIIFGKFFWCQKAVKTIEVSLDLFYHIIRPC